MSQNTSLPGLCLTAALGAALFTSTHAALAAQPSGLAAQYPGDKGIEKDPRVVFADNFETGDIDAIGKHWGQASHPENMTLEADTAAGSAGVRSLKMVENGHLYGHFKGLDSAYVRFYCKFAPKTGPIHHFVHLLADSEPTPWPRGGAGLRPDGNKGFTCGIEPGKFNNWIYYPYWYKMHSWQNPDGSPNNPPKGDSKSFYGNNFSAAPGPIPLGKWICVELMVKANTPGENDGELALWLDGQQASHWKTGSANGTWFRDGFRTSGPSNTNPKPFEGFDFRSTDKLKINTLWLLYFVDPVSAQEAAKRVQAVWFDDVVVASEYIGPLQAKP